MAGMKGLGLSLMIECIASLTANPEIAPALAGRTGTNMNCVGIALDIAAFGDRSAFRADADALGDAVAAPPPHPAHKRPLLPDSPPMRCVPNAHEQAFHCPRALVRPLGRCSPIWRDAASRGPNRDTLNDRSLKFDSLSDVQPLPSDSEANQL